MQYSFFYFLIHRPIKAQMTQGGCNLLSKFGRETAYSAKEDENIICQLINMK